MRIDKYTLKTGTIKCRKAGYIVYGTLEEASLVLASFFGILLIKQGKINSLYTKKL